MTLGANQIGAYAADLLDLEDHIGALQDSKRDLYAAIREEHGKGEAASLKLAVKLSRMDEGKRAEAEAVDTEAQRMLAIIAKAHVRRAPRAREIIEEFDAETGEITDSAAAGERHSREQITATEVAADQGGEDVAAEPDVLPANESTAARMVAPGQGQHEVGVSPRGYAGAGTQAPPVDTLPTAADNARKLRPVVVGGTTIRHHGPVA